ncbi:MAG: undecaprenyl-phosphate glucose phosphotransferase [bacterium]|nr:undecaprenyl-phosphate glucose phosphotransferase [bacterium]
MLKKYGQINVIVLFAGDALALSAAWFLAYLIRFHVGIIPLRRGFVPASEYMVLLPVVWAAWLLSARITHLYLHRTGLKSTEEIGRLTHTMAWAVMMLIALTFFFREQSYSRVMAVYFMVLGPFFLFLVRRLAWSLIRKLRRRGVDMRRILIVGTGGAARKMAELLRAHRYLGFELAGCLAEKEGGGAGQLSLPVLGALGDAPQVVERENIAEVYVALPASERASLDGLLDSLADSSVDLRLVPDVVDFMRLNAGIEDFSGIPIIVLSQSPLLGWNRLVKRLMDVVMGTLALALLSPVILIVAALVKLTSPGPLFYVQERMGLDGVSFQMYKFRSMKVDAEKETGAVWARPDDDRRTPVGAFLRRTSLDELPQLLNVIRGDMSLVGPRPERQVFVQNFRKSVPGYMLRHKMKSGITGWAQVNGWRGDTSIEKRIEFDLFYIENWSLGFDLKIMWMTLWKGFVNENAY